MSRYMYNGTDTNIIECRNGENGTWNSIRNLTKYAKGALQVNNIGYLNKHLRGSNVITFHICKYFASFLKHSVSLKFIIGVHAFLMKGKEPEMVKLSKIGKKNVLPDSAILNWEKKDSERNDLTLHKVLTWNISPARRMLAMRLTWNAATILVWFSRAF